jgi:hypothetical protein
MRRMRRALALASLSVALLAAGCGGPSGDTPVACLEGTSAYLAALRRAPGPVTLRGETPISSCLVENQNGGDLATVGAAMVEAASRLNAEARAHPGGAANVELGYLLGAAARGAESTEGIHADLIRRLTAAARYSPSGRPLPPAFLHAYRKGFDAGQASG